MGGSKLLKMYHGSPSKLVQGTYPWHHWIKWRFLKTPNWVENDLDSKDKFQLMEWLAQVLKIESLDEWYRVSFSNLRRHISLELFRSTP